MSVWKSPYILFPKSGDAIWIRRFPFYDTPVAALSRGTAGCRCQAYDTATPPVLTTLDIPWPNIHTWKPYP